MRKPLIVARFKVHANKFCAHDYKSGLNHMGHIAILNIFCVVHHYKYKTHNVVDVIITRTFVLLLQTVHSNSPYVKG